jgi:periplasmic protein TonB
MLKFLSSLLLLSICISGYSQDTIAQAQFEPVQVDAQFPGGLPGWTKYLGDSLNKDIASDCKLAKGKKTVKQTVIVSFKVDREGNISDVTAENASQVCPELAKEAIRVVKNGPRWVPARQNGRTVVSLKKQPITWVISEE